MKFLASFNSQISFVKKAIAVAAVPFLVATNTGIAHADDNLTDAEVTISKKAKKGDIKTGRFLDAAVYNIRYVTETLEGFTEIDGSFKFRPGETISFYIGDILIGSAKAEELLTPVALVANAKNSDALTNMLRFLQSLDADASPDNGIEIADNVHKEATDMKVNFDTAWAKFEVQDSLTSLLNIATNNPTLPELSDALIHFRETLLGAYEDDEEGVLNLVKTKWQGTLTSSECPDKNIKIKHRFNLLGHLTIGFHDLQATDNGCKGKHWAIYGAMWENDPLFSCATKCSFNDLNRTVELEFPRPHEATLIHEPGSEQITIIRTYEDGNEVIETLTKL